MTEGHTQTVGRKGESLACAFLEQQGYRILCQNYRTHLGEVDVIARDRATVCFIEVKARATRSHGAPEEAVTVRKQRQICRVALLYLMRNNQAEQLSRFDVVSIVDDENASSPEIRLIKDAFPLQQPYAY